MNKPPEADIAVEAPKTTAEVPLEACPVVRVPEHFAVEAEVAIGEVYVAGEDADFPAETVQLAVEQDGSALR